MLGQGSINRAADRAHDLLVKLSIVHLTAAMEKQR